jgi:predicted nucleotidyltransferase
VVAEFARAATLADLKALVRELESRSIPYMLIGGYALAAHGYQRATTDIDILFPATAAVGILVRDALLTLPDRAAQDIDPLWFNEGENIRVNDVFVIDIMLNANGQTYEMLKDHVQTIRIDDMSIKTVDLQGLLLTKQTLRTKDAEDRVVIELALQDINVAQ